MAWGRPSKRGRPRRSGSVRATPNEVLQQTGHAKDHRDRHRTIFRRLIEEYASYKPAYGDIRTEAVVDRERDHYEVMQVGWNGDRRVHGSIIHIAIRDGNVWIEYNGTDAPLGEELVVVGIPRHDIVLAFQPEELRPLTGFGGG
jgi:XisI protein